MKCCEFVITVDDKDQITAARTPRDEDICPSTIEHDELRDKTIEVFIELLRNDRLINEEGLVVLGSHLYTVLFNNKIGDALQDTLYDTKKSWDLIKVELVFTKDQAKIASWPWEYLYCPKCYGKGASGYFFSSMSNLLVSRRIPIDLKIRDIPIPTDELPLRILFVAAGPKKNEDPSKFEKLKVGPLEYETVLEELKKLKDESKGRIELYELVDKSKPG